MFADAVMAVLLSLPRKGNKRGRRQTWSIVEAQKRVDNGESKSKVAREFSEQTRTGQGKHSAEAARHQEGRKENPWDNYT